MAEEEVDFSKLPLEERCQHKNWKARVSAYDELTKIFQRIDDDKSGEWIKYGSWVRKFPTDSNAAAQEKALEVTLLYLENAGQGQVGRVVSEVMSGVVTKCITAPKAKSKELALNITLMCVEVEKFEAVQEELMKGMELKNPKVVAGCISFSTEILKAFGPKVINLKTILKKIPVLIEDRDKTVREETKKLMVELYRWLGIAFKPQLSAVKPLVVQEVEAEVEKCAEKPHQTRYLRSQQTRQEKVAEEGDEVDGDEDAVEEELGPDIDPYDLLDPVDILAKLPKDFYEKAEAKKWQERKEAMEALETLVANPKLEAGDYSDLVRMLKRAIGKDTNVVVVALAGKCVAGLANGLKKKFSPYAASCISTILEKFKEKKPNVVAAMRDAIDACFAATSLEQIQEDTLLALQNKNPSVKLETNAFLARAFAKTSLKTMSDKKLMKPYFTAIIVNLNESDASVREAAAEAFGVAMKHLGEKTLGAFIADLEPIKLQKIKEFSEKAVITAPKEKGVKPPPKAAAVKSSSSTRVAPKGGTTEKRPVVIPKKNTTTSSSNEELAKPNPTPKQSAVRVQSKTSGVNKTGVPVKKTASATKAAVEEPVVLGNMLPCNNIKAQRISDEMKLKILKWNFTTPRDEFVELLKELMIAAGIGQSLMANMFNTNFKMHLKALDTLQEEFNMGYEGTMANLDLILKWATLRFFDTNPSVLIRIMEYLGHVFRTLGDHQYNMADVEAGAFIPYLMLKIGDPKDTVRASVHNILRFLVNVYSPQRIFAYVMNGLQSKNARQRSECLDELAHMISTVGMSVIHPSPAAALKEIAKQISDRDNGVRNSALNAVVQAYYIEGEKIYKMIGQLADKDQSLLDERIKRAVKNRPTTVVISPPTITQQPSAANVPLTSRILTSHSSIPEPTSYNCSPPQAVSPVRPQPPVGNATIVHVQNMNSNTNTSSLPEKYRIDFDAIDNMFNDIEPIGPLELMDTNIDQFIRGEQISLPKRRVTGRAHMISKMQEQQSYVPQQANQSIDLVVSQISDSNLRKSIESCVKLEKMLIDPETSTIMCGRVDTMLSMIALQMRRQQPTLKSLSEDKLAELNKFLRSAVALLTVLFKGDFLPKKANKDSLRELIYHLLVLIIDEDLDRLSDAPTIIKLINVMVVRVIEKADPNSISCALIRLLNETLASTAYSGTRLLELVMKCQWKLLKQYNIWIDNKEYEWDIQGILMEFHSFIKAHPFTSFQNRDVTPLKTIKTILHALVIQVGCEKLQHHMNAMPDMRDSEAGLYLSKVIQRELLKKRAGGTEKD